ncbi:CLUMA_CG021266, isoform A [Clunio marinus]|uniref:CLUMA_CG021266, isoform A n=1 Tax=Clunio marinus TaxID=568069 RepID=A0A1J1J7R7_9DIPT|nr:CLUMA_CG021266, isoform A [Clunio marinus]
MRDFSPRRERRERTDRSDRSSNMPRFREWDLKCKVYVGNLGSSASKHEIEKSFSKYGPLRNVWVARNPPGFAFVEFEDSRDAEDAVRALDGTRVCGTRIRVEMSSGRTRRDEGRRGGPSRDDRRGGERRYRFEQNLLINVTNTKKTSNFKVKYGDFCRKNSLK